MIMKIQIKYREIYELSKFMKEKSEELDNNWKSINLIASSLSQALEGNSQVMIAQRINGFNDNNFKKICLYTKTLSDVLNMIACSYEGEIGDFAEEIKREALNYESN